MSSLAVPRVVCLAEDTLPEQLRIHRSPGSRSHDDGLFNSAHYVMQSMLDHRPAYFPSVLVQSPPWDLVLGYGNITLRSGEASKSGSTDVSCEVVCLPPIHCVNRRTEYPFRSHRVAPSPKVGVTSLFPRQVRTGCKSLKMMPRRASLLVVPDCFWLPACLLSCQEMLDLLQGVPMLVCSTGNKPCLWINVDEVPRPSLLLVAGVVLIPSLRIYIGISEPTYEVRKHPTRSEMSSRAQKVAVCSQTLIIWCQHADTVA